MVIGDETSVVGFRASATPTVDVQSVKVDRVSVSVAGKVVGQGHYVITFKSYKSELWERRTSPAGIAIGGGETNKGGGTLGFPDREKLGLCKVIFNVRVSQVGLDVPSSSFDTKMSDKCLAL